MRIQLLLLLVPSVASAATLCFEAELANDLSYPFEIAEVEGASGGLALTIPEGAGSRGAFGKKDTGFASYFVGIPAEGEYSIRMRVRWNGNCSNSAMLKIGQTKPVLVSTKTFGVWHWVFAGRGKFSQGTHEIRIQNREDGVWLDEILVSREDLELGPDPLEPDTIPRADAASRPEPRVFLSSPTRGIRALPPTDFKLTHATQRVMPLPALRTLVLREKGSTRLVVWLRNSSASDATGKVTFVSPSPVEVKPNAEQTFRMSRGESLKKLCFEVSPGAGLHRGLHTAFIRVRHQNGRIEGRKLLLLRPLQWLVTNAFPCPGQLGVEAPSAVEEAIGGDFPGLRARAMWRVVGEDAITPFGLLDMRRAVADKTYVMAYAFTRLRAAEAGDYWLSVRHDDMVRIWLNGAHVFTSLQCAPSASTRKPVRVGLKKGLNDLLVKVCQIKNYWELGVYVFEQKPAAAGSEVASLLQVKEGTP